MPNFEANASAPQVRFTKILATGRATKSHRLEDGKIITDSAPHVSSGRGAVVTLPPRLELLAEEIARLKSHECLLYGVPRDNITDFELLTKRQRLAGDRSQLARCRDDFTWGEGLGVFFVDHDPGPDGPLPPEQLVQRLVEAVPALAPIRWLVLPSSSSYIKRTSTGETLHSLRGFHAYALIEARCIPEFGSYLRDALAAIGDVRFEVSAAGALLERYCVDFAVHQPERIDFAAAPVVGPGLERFGREPKYVGGDVDVIDFDALPRLTVTQLEAAQQNCEAAKKAKADEARTVREARIADEVKRLLSAEDGLTPEVAMNRGRAMFERDELHGDAELVVIEDGRHVRLTVREALADRARWNGKLTLDPLEPDYRNHKVVGILYLGEGHPPLLHSQAHGGRTFTLCAHPRVELRNGELDEAVERTVGLMRDSDEFFASGGRVAIIDKETPVPIQGVALCHEIERRFEIVAWKMPRGRPKHDGVKPVAITSSFPREGADRITGNPRLIALLPRLLGVRCDPLLTPEGRWVGAPGYDPESGLWLALGAPVPEPIMPDDTAIREAAQVLLAPLRAYRFADERDRSAALLALLTAVVRPALPLAPGFLVTAAMRGSGKTKLAEVVGTLAGQFSLIDLTGSREEAAKRIDAFLLGGSPCLLADNLTTGDELDRPDVASLLTSERKSIRPFGSNAGTVDVDTRRVVIATANNPRLRGDAVRRVLPIRLEPAGVHPHLIAFGFDPVKETRRDRSAMVSAALVLLRGGTGTGIQSLGSFEIWSTFVGGALDRVIAAGLQGLAPFCDVINAATAADPLGDAANAFLDAIGTRNGGGTRTEVTVKEIGAMVSDHFGHRTNVGTGVEVASALDELASASGAGHGVWDGRGLFSPKLAGAVFAKLDGVLFHRYGGEWRCVYTPGRDRRLIVAPA